MKRTFSYKLILATGVAQPVFGTPLTQAVVPSAKDQFSNYVEQTLVVGDSSFFKSGDEIVLVDNDVTPPLPVADIPSSFVKSVPDATHVVVDRVVNAHPIGGWVILSIAFSNIYIQRKTGDASDMILGTNQDLTLASGLHGVAYLAPTGLGFNPSQFSDADIYGANPGVSSEWWVTGAVNESYLPSLTIT